MRLNQRYHFSVFIVFLSMFSSPYCQAKTAPGEITQHVYIGNIFSENSMNWSGRGNPSINEIAASESGEFVAFTVTLDNPWEKRLYFWRRGWWLRDITSSLPGPVNNGFKLNFLQLNDDGSRLFFVWNWITDIYYYEPGVCQPVVEGISSAQEEKPYAINSAGTRVFFKDTRFDQIQQKHISGIYYVDVGGQPQLLFNYEDLPCEDDTPPCSSWHSRLKFLDCSPDGSTVYFRWVKGETAYDKQSMFKAEVGGSPEMYPPEEHDIVWPCRMRNRIVSKNGDAVLYEYSDAGETRKLFLVKSGQKILLGETTDANGFAYPSLHKDGGFARFYARGGFMHTIWLGGFMRDSFSELIPSDGDAFTGKFMATDITKNYPEPYTEYFTASTASGVDFIHEISIGSRILEVEKIYYDRWPLLIDDETPLTVYAEVEDYIHGRENIEWVRMHSLVNGLEEKDWQLVNPDWNNTPPLYYEIELYDDGTNGGDEVANDGVYTNNTIKPRVDSGFYNQHGFPAYPGIRIVAKSNQDAYGIADSYIKVSKNYNIAPNLFHLLLGE